MTRPMLSFFNNKGGIGSTSLTYHVSSMLAEQGWRILCVDMDPQASLTTAFLDEDAQENIWKSQNDGVQTIYESVKPLLDADDLQPVNYRDITDRLALVPGDLRLACLEDALSSSWLDVMNDQNKARPLQILTAFWRSAQEAAERFEADFIVSDVGPNLGAINRSALLGSSHVVVPLGTDLLSLQGLMSLGPALRDWRAGWHIRKDSWKDPSFDLPDGNMDPLGYVAMRQSVRLTRPVTAFTRWLELIPEEFRSSVLDEHPNDSIPAIKDDPYCLAMLKNYNSLMPLSQEARKPIFFLRPADGAIGAHGNAVQEAYRDYRQLAERITKRMGLDRPSAGVLFDRDRQVS